MVRTRHSGGNEDSLDSFLPQRRSNSRRNSRSEPEEIVSTIQDGHLYSSPRQKQHKVFNLATSSSPVYNSTRSGRGRRSRLRSFSDDTETPRTRGRASNEGLEDDMPRRRPRQRISISPDNASHDEEEEDDRGQQTKTRTRPEEAGPRRSGRKRKPLYSTMNQALLGSYQLSGDADIYEWGTRTRSRCAAATGEKETKEEQPDDDEDGEGDEEREEPAGDNGQEEGEQDDDDEDDEDYQEGDENNNEEDEESERLDMYSRVKQRHIQARKLREARRLAEEEERRKEEMDTDDEEEEDSTEEEDTEAYRSRKLREAQRLAKDEEQRKETDSNIEDSTEEEDTEDDTSEEEIARKNYHLRKHRPLTKRFEVPVEVRIPRGRRKSEIEEVFGERNSPIRRRYPIKRNHLTPIRSPRFARRMHHATHHSSSTSSEGSGDDERRFERRKSKSMAKARMRCLPMNLNAEDVSTGVLRDRQKIGSSLADVDPMNIDTSITFESVGGLAKHIQSLKEMVVFPLLYPEVFTKFKINPQRGVLFHGPPGTGKTLVARALANECKTGDKKVAFFMRKGADCLSKWVGESERQLRLLFDQAYTMRPSIIFFDEIDGLAPVRSSRQDQIHSSIVSTLLALMDGLDSRGEIVVIGATNRIDSIDPALRRPGRFDREFLFQLPSCEARKSILSIHTKDWNPKLADSFLAEVAEKCVGYCGADLKALCTETALYALRHQYPQIYASKEKLQLDLSQIQVSARDFHLAMQNIVPAAQRAVVSPGRALSAAVKPLLQRQVTFIVDGLKKYFPVAFNTKKSDMQGNGQGTSEDVVWDLLNGDVYDDEDGPSIFEAPNPWKKRRTDEGAPSTTFMNFAGSSFSSPSAFRPRLLILGAPEQGHSTHVAPAILHHIEGIPVHCLDLPTMYAVSAKTPEESCAQVFREARRTAPSVIYMPHIVQWWSASAYTLQATFLTLLHDLPPSAPILVLATADCPMLDIPPEIKSLFHSRQESYTMRNPTTDERRAFFTELIIVEAAKAPPKRKKIAAKALEALPVALPREPRKLTEDELTKLRESEEATLRELRIFLREVLTRLAHERKFRTFTKAVDPEEVPDYFLVIKKPMDLSTIMNKINMHEYTSGKDFLVDIDQITSNALEYNPDIDPSDRQIRNYACELKDMAHAIIDAEMDPDFERMCCDIAKSRQERGDVVKSKDAPSYYRTLPQLQQEEAQKNAKNNPTPAVKRRPFPRVPMSPFRAIKRRRSSAWARGFLPKKKYPLKKKDESAKGNGVEGGEEPVKENHELRGIQRRVIKRKRRSTWSRGFIRKPKKKAPKVEESEEGEKDEDGGEAEEGCEKVEEDCGDGKGTKEHNSEKEAESDGSQNVEGCGEEGNKEEDNREGKSGDEVESTDGINKGEQSVDDPENNDQAQSGEDTDEYFDDKKAAAEKSKRVDDINVSGELDRTDGNEQRNTGLTNGIEASDDDSIKSAPVVRTDVSSEGKGGQVEAMEVTEINGEHAGGEEQLNSEPVGSKNDQEITGNAEDPLHLTRKAEIPLRRVTRRMLAGAHATRALQILEEPEPELVVDKERLQGLLESVVEVTSNWTVSRLEKIHCHLSQCIYRHRAEYDKGLLIKEMEDIVQSILTSP